MKFKLIYLLVPMLLLGCSKKSTPAVTPAASLPPITVVEPAETLDGKQIDQQIDQLVYDLYGLTEDEIKLVEGNT